MISLGIISLLASTLQNQQSMAKLRATYGRDVVPYSVATLVAGLFALLGVLALAAVVLRE
jgi:hypothetical protein